MATLLSIASPVVKHSLVSPEGLQMTESSELKGGVRQKGERVGLGVGCTASSKVCALGPSIDNRYRLIVFMLVT